MCHFNGFSRRERNREREREISLNCSTANQIKLYDCFLWDFCLGVGVFANVNLVNMNAITNMNMNECVCFVLYRLYQRGERVN